MNRLHSLSGRLLFVALYPFIRLFPKARTRVLVTDGRGNVLLMRGWFGRQRWDLPGGGIRRGEPPVEAAVRELREETGLLLKPDELTLLGEFSKETSDLSHAVILYYTKASADSVAPEPAHAMEVLEVKWWPVNRLPGRINMFVVRALRKLEEIEV